MYSGHNCTNYVAYVESTVNGAPTPSYNLGNADNWATSASQHGITVNQTPTVGSVAQWGDTASHTSGHVAYVESVQVNGSSVTSITVSEDVYSSGPFSWETITPGDANYPNNFIHFKDLPAPSSWGGIGTASFQGTDTLTAGHELDSNHYLLSADARFALVLQADGNLVLYGGTSIWQSGTSGSGATYLVMQTDGNLVLYTASNAVVWQSRTGGTGQAHLVVQADGNVVTYNNASGNPTWWTGTGGHADSTAFGADTLAAGQELDASGQGYLLSSDKRYGFMLQSDGTLVLYGPGYHVLWSHHNDGATRLVMQTDGNLVLYSTNTALWWTGTGGTGTNRAVMQTDGNFVEYTASNAPTWWTRTGGQI